MTVEPIKKNDPVEIPTGSGGGFGERLARLEQKVDDMKDSMATKTNLSDLKNWILGMALTLLLGLPAIAFFIIQIYNYFSSTNL